MNLRSSIRFLSSIRRDPHQVAVVGLGRFGRAVCSELHRMGYEVMGADRDEGLVSKVLTNKLVSRAIQLDSTDPNSLKESGILEFDVVVVAIGNYVQESIITALNVKEGGVKHVVAKASSDIHGKLLERVGADRVVFPERDAGKELAFSLMRPTILEGFELDEEHSIVEVAIPEEFGGKTLQDLQLRNNFGLNVIAVECKDRFAINPPSTQLLRAGAAMVVVGANKDIQRLPSVISRSQAVLQDRG
ncbi:MAG: TrkA family potassium uptake protein [Cyanobacteria bacterium J06641_5]